MTKDSALTAVILGVTGQDGSLLAAHLLEKGWNVVGAHRRTNRANLWRLDELGITDRIELVDLQLSNTDHLIKMFKAAEPQHIYLFAGMSTVAETIENPRGAIEINTLGPLNVAEAMSVAAPEAKLFFASSSEIFAAPNDTVHPLTENSVIKPTNPYAVAKAAAQNMFDIYRQRQGLHITSGIMFNHESAFRSLDFVTRKISYHMARLKAAGGEPVRLGNLDAERDWGAAEDYVRIMHEAIEHAPADNYVFATGVATRVRTFLSMTAQAAGFDPQFEGNGLEEVCRDGRTGRILTVTAPEYYQRVDTTGRIGSMDHLRTFIDVPPLRSIEALTEGMFRADVIRREKGLTHV